MMTGEKLTDYKINPLKMYGGMNGNKIGVVINNENYMIKFPPKPTKNKSMTYSNSCLSEYIACHIFQLLGIKAQETFLIEFQNKIVVACKDFETNGYIFKDFGKLKNTVVDSSQSGYGTELVDILNTIEEQNIISPLGLKEFFWDMFIVDAFLGNFDRHNGNWGFLINENTGSVNIAPIFDCGSCLYPQIDENIILNIVGNSEEMEKRVYEYPTSAIKKDDKKINYPQFLNNTDDMDCLNALKKINNKIDLEQIDAIVDSTPYVSQIYKEFMKTIIMKRKTILFDYVLLNNINLI